MKLQTDTGRDTDAYDVCRRYFLVGENWEEVNNGLDEWRSVLEGKRLKISRNKQSMYSTSLEKENKRLTG